MSAADSGAVNSPVKLAIVRQRYNAFGGAERFVERAAAALRAQGASVTIVSREWSGRAAGRTAAGGTEGDTWLRCDPFYFGRLWRDWSFARAACRAARCGDFDLVQSHERIACCDVYRAGDGVHAQWLENRARQAKPWVRRWAALNPYHRYVLAAERRMFASPRLRAVICNSRMVRDEIRRWFALEDERLHVVYNGVDLENFHPGLRALHSAELRARLGVPDAAPVVLFVGSGFERKGVGALLRALAGMGRRDVHLAIVGKDRAQFRFEALARSLGIAAQVHWAGAQNEVRPWYGMADLFVLPTLYDPFPNAALEAMACGVGVITTRQCGAAEAIEDGANGYVCRDPADAQELASRMSAALERGRELGVRARAVAECFGVAAMAERLLSLYRSLLRK